MLTLVLCALFLSPLPARAAEAGDPAVASLRQEIQKLSKKMDELAAQQKTILETQNKILQELQVVKIRIRRN
ncbi:MAG: hypothetical protein HY714_00890 [Candidatus Omnitrophica bacterium]|nr:hypothetical protein [Candidatus Omnitrophota bacterium]